MFIRKAQGAALSALLVSAAVPALAQDDSQVGLFQVVPGTAVVFSPDTGLYYQVPVNFAYEICPDIDQAYLVTDFAGTTEVVCEVDAATVEERDFTGFAWARDNDNDGEADERGEAAMDDDGDDPADGGADAGADADAGAETDVDAGVETGDDGADVDAGVDADASVDSDTDAGAETNEATGSESGSAGN
jgi:hypothetical protein